MANRSRECRLKVTPMLHQRIMSDLADDIATLYGVRVVYAQGSGESYTDYDPVDDRVSKVCIDKDLYESDVIDGYVKDSVVLRHVLRALHEAQHCTQSFCIWGPTTEGMDMLMSHFKSTYNRAYFEMHYAEHLAEIDAEMEAVKGTYGFIADVLTPPKKVLDEVYTDFINGLCDEYTDYPLNRARGM